MCSPLRIAGSSNAKSEKAHARCEYVKKQLNAAKTYVCAVSELRSTFADSPCINFKYGNARAREKKMYEDNWLIEFKDRAAPRLREMFERDLDRTPAFLSDLLTRLQQSEKESAHTG